MRLSIIDSQAANLTPFLEVISLNSLARSWVLWKTVKNLSISPNEMVQFRKRSCKDCSCLIDGAHTNSSTSSTFSKPLCPCLCAMRESALLPFSIQNRRRSVLLHSVLSSEIIAFALGESWKNVTTGNTLSLTTVDLARSLIGKREASTTVFLDNSSTFTGKKEKTKI